MTGVQTCALPISEGLIAGTQNTDAKRYHLRDFIDELFPIEIGKYALEDVVWRHKILPVLEGHVRPNMLAICQYSFAEMLNNVFDHSRAF